jgi:integrase
MTTSITSRARIARRKAQRLELHMSQRGTTYELTDGDGVTHELGALAVIETYLGSHYVARRPGPRPSATAPPAWVAAIDAYLISLAAMGQRDSTIHLRRALLTRMARGLGCGPCEVTAERLVAWFGRQRNWEIETRRSYRAAARGFFAWCYKTGRLPIYLADELPRVRSAQPHARPAPDAVWAGLLTAAAPREALMALLAAEAGLRRAEVAQVHRRDLIDGTDGSSLLVHGKGGKQRVVPISDSLAELLRQGAPGHTPERAAYGDGGWLFPSVDGHLSPDCVGRLISKLMPKGWTMHTLRHRFATRAYRRGTHNLRAVQVLLGHASIATTERYLAVDDSEIRAAMVAAAG